MSLDVWLTEQGATRPTGSGIFTRENGRTIEVTVEEWNAKHPDMPALEAAPSEETTDTVFNANITHNLTAMADAAELYMVLWRPDELGITKACALIEPLRKGLNILLDNPAKFKALNPTNGWGSYDSLVQFVVSYRGACMDHPDAVIGVSR
jgi:hypothetical protein